MLKAILLAAGKGTRMNSDLPKVLHKAGGREMINQVIELVKEAGIEEVVAVLGHGADQVLEKVNYPVQVAMQEEQLGTGHAVMQAADYINEGQDILVICGDTPLFRSESIKEALKSHQEAGAAVTVISALLEDSTGYGRVVRSEDGQEVLKIVEEKDASPQEKAIKEINTGTWIFSGSFLKENIFKLDNKNAQNEYYLTDLLEMASQKDEKCQAYILAHAQEALGINNKVQLAQAEKVLRQRKVTQLMEDGVTFMAPETAWIDPDVQIGPDTIIYPNVIIEGTCRIGPENIIGPDTRIIDSEIGARNTIEQAKILESKMASDCCVGPYAYLRPGTVLADRVKIGDFTEVKNSTIGECSKIPHLSYVGDAQVGAGVNIGCGVITANYDGKNKYQTIIEDGVFVGSNSNLIAPVRLGKDSYVAAGSTINKEVAPGNLAIARSKQKNIENFRGKKNGE